jgi:predicted MFS family arabinose efflux permease
LSALPWLFVLTGLISLDARIIAPVLPAIAASLGVTPGEAGLAMTAYTLPYGVMQVVYGPLSDRYGRVRVIRLTAAAFVVGTALSGLAPGLGTFLSARFLTGVVAAATIPTTFAYIGDTVPYARRHTVIVRMSIAVAAAQALSAAMAGTVTHLVSWRVLFGGYAVLTLLTVAAMGGGRESAQAPATERVTYARLLQMRAARRVYLAACVEGFLFWGGTTYLAVLVQQRLDWNDLQVALLVATFGLGTIAGGLMLGRLAPALGERTLVTWGGALQGVGFIALVPALPWPVIALALFAIGVGFTGVHSTLQTRGTELVPGARGKAFSLFALGYFVGGAAGTAALGRLVDAGRLDLAMILCGAGLAAVGWFVRRS